MDIENPSMDPENLYMDLEDPYMDLDNLCMDLENLYMDLDNLYMDPKNLYTGCIWRGASPPAPPLAPPARVMLMRGRAEYRRSPSGAHEMCLPTGPAGEMCVPKPFSCFVFGCSTRKTKDRLRR